MQPQDQITAPNGRRGVIVTVSPTGYTCEDAEGYFFVERELRTAWGAKLGGAINPELMALAERVKGRKAQMSVERIREILYPNIDGVRFFGSDRDDDIPLGTLPREQFLELRELLGLNPPEPTAGAAT
jgi:hypothetical protein